MLVYSRSARRVPQYPLPGWVAVSTASWNIWTPKSQVSFSSQPIHVEHQLPPKVQNHDPLGSNQINYDMFTTAWNIKKRTQSKPHLTCFWFQELRRGSQILQAWQFKPASESISTTDSTTDSLLYYERATSVSIREKLNKLNWNYSTSTYRNTPIRGMKHVGSNNWSIIILHSCPNHPAINIHKKVHPSTALHSITFSYSFKVLRSKYQNIERNRRTTR